MILKVVYSAAADGMARDIFPQASNKAFTVEAFYKAQCAKAYEIYVAQRLI